MPILIGELVAVRVIPVDLMAAGRVPFQLSSLSCRLEKTQDSARSAIICWVKANSRSSSGRHCQLTQLILVVLTVGVVVAKLAASHLVAGEEVGSALGEQQGGNQIAFLLLAQAVDPRIQSRPLHPVVIGEVVAVAIPIVLTIGLIVALVVGDQNPPE